MLSPLIRLGAARGDTFSHKSKDEKRIIDAFAESVDLSASILHQCRPLGPVSIEDSVSQTALNPTGVSHRLQWAHDETTSRRSQTNVVPPLC